MKVAMFGGSFDPVHNAHIYLCKSMIEDFSLDKVIVFPAASSPFKDNTKTPSYHRYNMCKLAFEDIDRVEVSDFEISRGGKSYTVDTLNMLKSAYPDAELYLITGADAFITIDKWYNSYEIFKLAHILTVIRDDDDINVLSSKADEFKAMGCKSTLVNKSMGEISSTYIRNSLSKGECPEKFLPKKVLNYIIDNKLYDYGY